MGLSWLTDGNMIILINVKGRNRLDYCMRAGLSPLMYRVMIALVMFNVRTILVHIQTRMGLSWSMYGKRIAPVCR